MRCGYMAACYSQLSPHKRALRLSAERLQRAVQLGQRESCGGARVGTVITYGSYDVHTDRSAALYGRSGPYGSRMNYHVTQLRLEDQAKVQG